ncbi:hypothetical protein GCM10009808_25810 [Microbacterium sediminicola]|uniref:Cupin type-2 domain-containing protein n=1 Tax=Microbacterium sediminicola TaxID=415210 RepID=A0ABP4UJF2_9MICO
MAFDKVVHGGHDDFAGRGISRGAFSFDKRTAVAKEGTQLQVAFMEIPPGKSAFPYHWHAGITEAYVILSGTGRVRTPEGEFDVAAGEVVVFPPGPAGAHRMTATGDEPLRYVDLDTTGDPDVIGYPDSGKTMAYTTFRKTTIFRDADDVDYFEGEPDAE